MAESDTMKAIQIREFNQPFKVSNVPKPKIQPYQVSRVCMDETVLFLMMPRCFLRLQLAASVIQVRKANIVNTITNIYCRSYGAEQ